MTDLKISEFEVKTSLGGTEMVPVTYNGQNYQVSAALFFGADGDDGKSAYQLAVLGGFEGTQAEWLASLKGTDGAPGEDGAPGVDGDSAYQIAVAQGFVGTITEWLASLNGTDGDPGLNGKSAYDIAVDNGFEGTPSEWLASLQGEQGEPGTPGSDGVDGDPGVGVPTGGTTGQVLSKASGSDFDTAWIDPPAGSGGGTSGPGEPSTVLFSGTATGAYIQIDNVDLYSLIRLGFDNLSSNTSSGSNFKLAFSMDGVDFSTEVTLPAYSYASSLSLDGFVDFADTAGLVAQVIAATRQPGASANYNFANTDGKTITKPAAGRVKSIRFIPGSGSWDGGALTVLGIAASGVAGADGASAYEIAVADGFTGTESEWLASLVGPAGEGGGLPDGGTEGQVVVKQSDGSAAWGNVVAKPYLGSMIRFPLSYIPDLPAGILELNDAVQPVALSLFPSLDGLFPASAPQLSVVEELTAPVADKSFGKVVAMSADGNYLAAVSNEVNTVYVYFKDAGTWTLQQKIGANPASTLSFTTVAISSDGSRIAVTDNGNNGNTYIFLRAGTTWSEEDRVAQPASASNQQSISINADGSVVAIGYPLGGAVNGGVVQILTRTNSVWTQHSTFSGGDTIGSDKFGISVALSAAGKDIIIGASWADPNGSNNGAVYKFHYNQISDTWEQSAKVAPNSVGSNTGQCVAATTTLSRIFFGGPNYSGNTGAVWWADASGSTYAIKGPVQAADKASNEYFGTSVACSADGAYLFVGAISSDGDDGIVQGAIYIFAYNGTGYDQVTRLESPSAAVGARIGQSVTCDSTGSAGAGGGVSANVVPLLGSASRVDLPARPDALARYGVCVE